VEVMENKRILITGGAGFIGSNLAEELVKDNTVIVYDNLNSYYDGKEQNIETLYKNENFDFIKGDILNYNSLRQALKNIEVVFHLAAQSGVRYSMTNPLLSNRINTEGTLNVLMASKENNIETLVNASTSSVYGNQKKQPTKETSQLLPISIYSVSKIAAENYCSIFANSYNMNIRTVRYFTVYGPRQRPDMAINIFVNNALFSKPSIVFGDGNQTRDFTYISDIVSGTIAAAETPNCNGEIFNIGSGNSISVNDLLNNISKITGHMEIKYENKNIGDVDNTLADISKARSMLNYEPKVGIIEGLSKYKSWCIKKVKKK
jgi:UDP-glucose 4-epimerase